MHKTVQTLRLVLPIAFLVFLIVLIFNYTSRELEDQEPSAPIDAVSPIGEDPARVIAYEFDDTHSIGGRVLSRILAEKTVGFESGWYTLEGVQLDIYRKDGSTYSVSSPSARFKPDSKEAQASGGVRVFSNDGLSIATREVTFDGSSLRNRIPIEFQVDQWKGHAGGVELDVKTETVRLIAGVQARMSPVTEAETPLSIEAIEAIFDRETGEALFVDDVEVVRGREVLAADRVVARFDQNRRILLGLEGTGEVFIKIGKGSMSRMPTSSVGAGENEIRASRFTVETGPDGAIRAANATAGEGKVHATLRGTVLREIVAKKFRVSLDSVGVNSMEASGEAVLTENGPDPRTIKAGTFRLYFDPTTGESTSAFLENDFLYEDSKIRAQASNANYSITDDRIVLTAEAGSAPTLTAAGIRIRAHMIEVAPERQVLTARGQVVARIEKSGTNGAAGSSLFPDNNVVFVNAESLFLEEGIGRATFSGNVRAWQSNNAIFAEELQILDEGNSVSARGEVRCVLYNTSDEKRTEPVGTKSDRLAWNRSDNRLKLSGEVTIEDAGRILESTDAVFVFNESQDLERVEAANGVQLTEEKSGRSGVAENAVYYVSDRRIVLEGSPASISDAQGTIRGAQIVFDVERNRVDVTSGEGQTDATYQPDTNGRI